MTVLVFPREEHTVVLKNDDGNIVIQQFEHADDEDAMNFVILTPHQFLEIYNRSKRLLEAE
jgi:hypothetical protein